MYPLRIITISRRILISAVILVASLIFYQFFLYQVHAQLLQGRSASSSGGMVYLSVAAEMAAVASSTKKAPPMHEVTIANNGAVLLRGARVIVVNGSTMRVGITWDSGDFVWTIETLYDTKFFSSTGQKETPQDVAVGDIVTITGNLKSGGAEPTVEATFVRERN